MRRRGCVQSTRSGCGGNKQKTRLHRPAAADRLAAAAAVGEGVGVVAAGVLEYVGGGRQPVGGAVVIDARSVRPSPPQSAKVGGLNSQRKS